MSRTERSIERYDLSASPFRQNPTQRDFANLLGFRKSELEAMVARKDTFIVRRDELIGKKLRKLVYPRGKLRTVHERLKHHLNKVRQPDHLFSPRKGRAQRDNALVHLDRTQFLFLDIRQFYPSTTCEHVYRWARYAAGLRDDVAGLFMHLATVDGRLCFGSPLSPVLAALVHRSMFEAIDTLCKQRGLRMSLWVDNLTISGLFTPGDLVEQIRDIIRCNGLQSHDIEFKTSSKRPVIVTGVPVSGDQLAAPRSLHQRIQEGYAALAKAEDDWSRGSIIEQLLSHLGSYRYIVGRSSLEGRRAADRMNALRQRRAKLTMQKLIQ